jgi:alpha-mannosidase
MLTMGCDFNYQDGNPWFKNLDKIIHYVNQDVCLRSFMHSIAFASSQESSMSSAPCLSQGRINAFYSTPTIYTQAKYDANVTWTTKQDDWFPYADSPHSVWSGYFTSRPALKG